jgi:hypothetical protein
MVRSRPERGPIVVSNNVGTKRLLAIGYRPDAGHEVLDLGNDLVLITGPHQVVRARQLDVPSVRDMVGEVAPVLHEVRHIGPLDDQRRDTDRGQDLAESLSNIKRTIASVLPGVAAARS